MDIKLKLNVIFNRARYNLMFMIMLSAINVYFLLTNESFYLPFSSSISSYSIVLGIRASADLANEGFKIIGIILACAALALYLICYLKSKSNAFFLFMSFTVFIADTLALIVITVAFKAFNALSIIDIILHLMTLFFLWSGIQAQGKLAKLSKQTQEDDEEENDCSDSAILPLLSGNYNNNRVEVVLNNGTTELLINNTVYDSLNTSDLCVYKLNAVVDEVEYNFEYKSSCDGVKMALYADGVLLDSLNHAS